MGFSGKSAIIGSDTDGERIDLEDAGLKKVVPVKNMDDAGKVIGAPSSTIGSGSKTVTSAGTAVALAASTACRRVTIQAKSANTGSIYVGDSSVDSTNGIELTPYNSVVLNVDDLDIIYIDSAVSSEGVNFLYEV